MGKVKEKIQNFWYYYKWHTLIILFFVIIGSVLITELVKKPKYDVKILYAGPAIITDTQREEIVNAFTGVLPKDFDGDGEKKAELFDIIIMNNEQLKEANKKYSYYFLNEKTMAKNKENLTMNAMAGEYVLYLVDENCYDVLKNHGVFVKLDDIDFEGGERKDEYAVKFKSLDYAKFHTAFDVLPDTTLLCVRNVNKEGRGAEDRIEFQSRHIELFKAMIAFKSEENPDEKTEN